MSHFEIPVKLEAWLRVEDGNVTGVDLCLDTVELDREGIAAGRNAFEYVDPSDADSLIPDITAEKADEVFEALPSRRDWAVTRVETSDGAIWMND